MLVWVPLQLRTHPSSISYCIVCLRLLVVVALAELSACNHLFDIGFLRGQSVPPTASKSWLPAWLRLHVLWSRMSHAGRVLRCSILPPIRIRRGRIAGMCRVPLKRRLPCGVVLIAVFPGLKFVTWVRVLIVFAQPGSCRHA